MLKGIFSACFLQFILLCIYDSLKVSIWCWSDSLQCWMSIQIRSESHSQFIMLGWLTELLGVLFYQQRQTFIYGSYSSNYYSSYVCPKLDERYKCHWWRRQETLVNCLSDHLRFNETRNFKFEQEIVKFKKQSCNHYSV